MCSFWSRKKKKEIWHSVEFLAAQNVYAWFWRKKNLTHEYYSANRNLRALYTDLYNMTDFFRHMNNSLCQRLSRRSKGEVLCLNAFKIKFKCKIKKKALCLFFSVVSCRVFPQTERVSTSIFSSDCDVSAS